MTSNNLECIYVDSNQVTPSTFERDDEGVRKQLSSAPVQTQETVLALLKSFTSVHVCPQAEDVLRILESRKRSPGSVPTCILVYVAQNQSPSTLSKSRVGLNLPADLEELDSLSADHSNHLRGLDLLRYLNLFIARSQLTDVVSAALLQTIDKTMLRAIVDIGTDQYITNAQDSLDVQRLAMLLFIKRQDSSIVANQQVGEADNAVYENEDVQPSVEQWQGLRMRAENLYIPNRTKGIDLIDHHMPPYEPAKVTFGYHDSEVFLSKVPRLQALVSTWAFSTLDLSEEDLIDCAVVIFKHVLTLPGTEEWGISDEELFSFVDAIRRLYYTTNPYHNFRHAVDVLQAVFFMLLSAAAFPAMNEDCPTFVSIGCPILGVLLTPKYILGACIVGIGHDVGHPGVNNAFLVSTRAPLALLYNDRSVLENLHCAALGRILFQKWPATQESSMRKIIIELLLSTDMALHFDYMSRFKEMATICLETRKEVASEGPKPDPVEIPAATLDKYKVTLFSALIKCGDISNVARPFTISRGWSHALLREFFNQARLEKTMGIPVTKNFDPEQTRQADSQTFFINLFAAPLFNSLEQVLPNLVPISQTILSNRDTWKNNGVPLPVVAATSIQSPNDATTNQPDLSKPLLRTEDHSLSSRGERKTSEVDAEAVQQADDELPAQKKKGFCLPQLFKKKRQAAGA